ncbi:MAG: diguanylate cyclase [Deltaproteobacteria bacterium]|nr:diguanylate cyclase [Deltaproteobacteria bacterium]
MTVLIADSDLITRTLLEKSLGGGGYDVAIAATPEEAELVLLGNTQINAVVVDGKVSGGFGTPLCSRLRQRAGERPLFVIMMIRREDGSDIRSALENGANEVINKPVNIDEMLARLANGLRMLEAEESLWTARAYLAAVMDNLDVGVIITGTDGRVAQANEAIARVGGVPPEHIIGRERSHVYAHWQGRDDRSASTFIPGREDVDLPGRQRRVLRVTRALSKLPWGEIRIELCQDASKEILYDEFVEKSSQTDPVTGVLNRQGGETALRKALDRSQRHSEGLSVGALRLANLPSTGGPAGPALVDKVLRQVAQLLVRLTRGTDEVARWSADGFIVVLHNAAKNQADVVIKRLQKAVTTLQVEGAPSLLLAVGITECDNAASVEEVIERAWASVGPATTFVG